MFTTVLINGRCVVSFQAAKICNNMLLAIGMIGTAETMNLGIRYKNVMKSQPCCSYTQRC